VRLAATMLVGALAMAGPAWAAPAPEVPLEALQERSVVLVLQDGAEESGTLLGSTADQVVLARGGSGEVVTVPRREVVAVRLASSPSPAVAPSSASAPAPAEPPRSRLGLGVQLGLPPAAMIDLELGRLYAYVSVSVFLPFFSQDEFPPAAPPYGYGPTTSQVWAVGVGVGATFQPLGAASPWHLDLFGLLNLDDWHATQSAGLDVSFGVGLGAHWTLPSGFTVGLKLPLIGAGVATRPDPGPASGSVALIRFFVSTVAALPVLSLGYRF
jgi:hypothetical protein